MLVYLSRSFTENTLVGVYLALICPIQYDFNHYYSFKQDFEAVRWRTEPSAI